MTNPYDSLNDFIHAGAARMFEDNAMTIKRDYLYYENTLRRWVEMLITTSDTGLSSMGWVLRRTLQDGRVVWSLDRRGLTYYDYDDDTNFIYDSR